MLYLHWVEGAEPERRAEKEECVCSSFYTFNQSICVHLLKRCERRPIQHNSSRKAERERERWPLCDCDCVCLCLISACIYEGRPCIRVSRTSGTSTLTLWPGGGIGLPTERKENKKSDRLRKKKKSQGVLVDMSKKEKMMGEEESTYLPIIPAVQHVKRLHISSFRLIYFLCSPTYMCVCIKGPIGYWQQFWQEEILSLLFLIGLSLNIPSELISRSDKDVIYLPPHQRLCPFAHFDMTFSPFSQISYLCILYSLYIY
jgi:hypothetical protein